MLRNIILLTLFSFNLFASIAQNTQPVFHDDSTNPVHKYLPDLTVVGRMSKTDVQQLPEVVGTSIYAGKKNALIVLDNVQGNVVTNNMRQVMAKIPGIHIWESDPSGIQIGIAARGLSPNRSWEFNIRQNGYDIAADPFGYPEAYYNPQLQAVQRIEIVRGQGSLQYGPQFGGLVNYILRNGSEIKKKFEFETQQTIGSNALFNTYNAIGGRTDKLHYYSFFDHRNGDGWRNNSRYFTNSAYGTLTYKLSPKMSLTAELMHSHIRSQQPGGLTDAALYDNASQSLRARNWFDIKWTTPALIFNYQLNERSRINTKLFATLGDRNSVGFLQNILVKDTINLTTGEYNNRVLSSDSYRNFGMETRYITEYGLFNQVHTLSSGIRIYTGKTHRVADGKGTTGSDYDMTVIGVNPRDINFHSDNAAVFLENIFRISEKILLVPGIRYEWLKGSASGRSGFTSGGAEIILQDVTRHRDFILAGMGAEYHITNNTEFYASYAQAYRPIQFANLQAAPTTDVIDQNLEDSKGFNADLGYRGKLRNVLQFDVSAYYLLYGNRIGRVGNLITNVGESVSKGVEAFAEVNIAKAVSPESKIDLLLSGSYSYNDAKYADDNKDVATRGKRVENAPRNIFRGGLTASYQKIMLTGQLSYVSSTFSDATNTAAPTANAQSGLIPSYTVTDLTATYRFNAVLNIKAGLNNLFNEKYFTRRAGGYPGPGALPADGRTFFISFGAKL